MVIEQCMVGGCIRAYHEQYEEMLGKGDLAHIPKHPKRSTGRCLRITFLSWHYSTPAEILCYNDNTVA